MTKLEQLIQDLCPNGVKMVKLGDVVASIHSGLNPRDNFRLNENGATGYYVTVKEITSGKIEFTDKTDRITLEAHSIIQNRSHLEVDDVLLSGIGTIGKVALVDIPVDNWNCSESVLLLKPNKERILPKFLVYILQSKQVQSAFQRDSVGSTLKGIRKKNLESLQIPLPPLAVQSEIVRLLDKFTLYKSELAAELAARCKQYEHYRNQLLTFNENTKRVKLGEVAEIGTGSSNTNEGKEEGAYPFYVRSQTPLRKDTFEYDETAIITAGDGVGVGKVFHFVQGKYALHQRAYRIHLTDEKLNPKYLYFYMVTMFADYIHKTMFHSSVSSIRRPMLTDFPIPLPPLEIQEQIVAILDRFDALCNDIKIGLPAEIELRQKQYEHYRDKLLTF